MTLTKPKEKEAASETPKKRKRLPKKWLIIALAAVLLAALVLPRFTRRSGGTSAEAAYTTAEPTKRTITKSLSGSGTLQPANS